MVERILDWVEDTRMTQKVLLLLLMAGFVSITAFQFVVEPQRQRVQGFQHMIQSLDRQLAANEQGRQFETLKNDIARLTPRLEAQRTVLGLQVPVDHMLTDILDKAQSAGVALTSWKSDEPAPIPDMDVHRVTLRLYMQGRYHAFAHFLESLQTLPSALKVQSMDFQAREGSDENPEQPIQASFELTGFQAATVEATEQRVSGKGTG